MVRFKTWRVAALTAIIQLGKENPKIDVEVDVAVAPVAAEQERPVRVSRRQILDPRAAVARETAARDRGVGVDASTLAARQSETSDLRKQVASALDEERKRVAKRAKELASVEGELAKLATKEQADVATLRGRLEGLSKRLAAANTDAKRKKEAYEAAVATASKLEQEKKELHEHLAMMVLSSEQRKEDKLKELLAAMGATDVSESKYGS